MKLVSAADTNPANNSVCTALPKVLWLEYKLKSVTLSALKVRVDVTTGWRCSAAQASDRRA